MNTASKPLPWEKLPWRWVVERTLAWLGHSRRLSKDYEILSASEETMVKISHIHTLVKHLWIRFLNRPTYLSRITQRTLWLSAHLSVDISHNLDVADLLSLTSAPWLLPFLSPKTIISFYETGVVTASGQQHLKYYGYPFASANCNSLQQKALELIYLWWYRPENTQTLLCCIRNNSFSLTHSYIKKFQAGRKG